MKQIQLDERKYNDYQFSKKDIVKETAKALLINRTSEYDNSILYQCWIPKSKITFTSVKREFPCKNEEEYSIVYYISKYFIKDPNYKKPDTTGLEEYNPHKTRGEIINEMYPDGKDMTYFD